MILDVGKRSAVQRHRLADQVPTDAGDDLLGQQQVVIKSLEANYRRVDGISGATILGDGSVALIIDIPGLMRLAKQHTGRDRSPLALSA